MLIRDIVDFLLPATCCVCGSRLISPEKAVCTTCLGLVSQTNYHLSSPNPLERVFWGQVPIERAAAFMFYNTEASRHMVMANKYLSHPEVGYNVARIYAEQIAGSGFFHGIDMIVPVPISWQRAWMRRYNQSEGIARGVSDATGIAVRTDIIKKVKHTKKQTSLTHDQRLGNISDAYRLVRPDAVRGKHVLLVDDVVTTGATMLSCARELMKADDVTFSVLALAHATPNIIPRSSDGVADSSWCGLPIPSDL